MFGSEELSHREMKPCAPVTHEQTAGGDCNPDSLTPESASPAILQTAQGRLSGQY